MNSLCRVFAAFGLIAAAGCAGSLPVADPPGDQRFVTVPVDNSAFEDDLITRLKLAHARVEKDANGDARVYDSPDCRRVLVELRRSAREQLDVIAQNLANMQTTHDINGKANPYRRQMMIQHPDGTFSIVPDPSPFILHHEPNNPDADANGNVRYPNVDATIEAVNAQAAEADYRLAAMILAKFDPTMVTVHVDVLTEDPTATGLHRQSN